MGSGAAPTGGVVEAAAGPGWASGFEATAASGPTGAAAAPVGSAAGSVRALVDGTSGLEAVAFATEAACVCPSEVVKVGAGWAGSWMVGRGDTAGLKGDWISGCVVGADGEVSYDFNGGATAAVRGY